MDLRQLWAAVVVACLCAVAGAEEPAVFTHLQALPPASELTKSAAAPYDLLQEKPPADAAELFWRDKIYTLLNRHHQPVADEPAYLQRDMALMADYFARYQEVRELFSQLEGKPWRWQYGSHQAETRVSGTRLQVKSVNVHFDSRAGAQFQFRDACASKIPYCFTAPADVFLHELLHVRTILGNPGSFIAQGGMAEHIYPHQHEQHTINAERQLYAAMTRRDAIPRPARSSHTGRRTSTRCVTCLQ